MNKRSFFGDLKNIAFDLEKIIQGLPGYDDPSEEEIALHKNLYNLLSRLKKLADLPGEKS